MDNEFNAVQGTTIAAVSTPQGEGGIGVIRISGADAVGVADSCFRSFSGEKIASISGYSALYGRVFDGEEPLDEAVALLFRAPKSYTGEDVVELSVHGGRIMVKAVLRAVISCGARLADRGEFSKRAFLNGKMDLAKAESIIGIISAGNDAALRISRAAKSGRISREIETVVENLLETAASLSVYADYPDEEIEGLCFENFCAMLSDSREKLERLISNYDAGRVIREGIDCAIVGKPNVGKSTLMNLLVGSERSIVTDVAGTTRDVIEENVTVGGVVLRLADTAGIHETDDTVERVGVERAKQRIDNAGIILAVFDASSPLDENDFKLLKELKDRPCIVILNKTDMGIGVDKSVFEGIECVEVCAKEGVGLEALSDSVKKVTKANCLDPDTAVLISERQRECAVRAYGAVNEALASLQAGITLDAVGVCIDDALVALLELTGKRVTNEVSDEVFRRFCVGK
ncbi:MAG: tRNA uridine-5-carboxymethylaminomethyl(34) synthesis GTPase MnmE [Ruminococcaceae bacterium]|nr:tRNA uridine-5-carboxymethylaminomethyl(34) synthesis GTPase MnmE [Oscillospiraceae bacterium]